ncbi:MAG: cystathionine beta-lyase [Pseudomonadota bacterium]
MTRKPRTRLIHKREGGRIHPTVNPPVERGSTLLLDTSDELYGAGKTYGRMGLSVHRELEAALRDLEDAQAVQLTSSGLTACALAIASITRSGDHIVAQDSLYGPTRRFCERRLKAMGVETSFFPPRDFEALEAALTPKTRAVFLETPGSLTFECPDLLRIVEFAKARNVRVVVDNTWSAGVFLQPLTLGVDVSVQALTKYVGGHSDAFGGAVMSGDPSTARLIERTAQDWGLSASPDDAALLLRGLRTLHTRLDHHQEQASTLADWLAVRSEVELILHPARPDHPDHEIWARDFSGSSGLFSAVLKPTSETGLAAFFDGLELFGLGFSWGGFESLAIPARNLRRLPGDWSGASGGELVRFHVGLEDIEDLKDDLARAFERLVRAD